MTESPESCSRYNKLNSPAHYVGIGASAGGLDALQQIVRDLPIGSDITYIIIQHLSPNFKSVIDELLTRCTKLKVVVAEDGVEVQANTIYLIPPRKDMMIAEGKLILVDQTLKQAAKFPIDTFFRSLAQDQLNRSVGIILSGTGSDGSRGIQAIKEAGGRAIVQDPSDAKFDGMPVAAIKANTIDIVCSANDIPTRLVEMLSQPLANRESPKTAVGVDKADTVLEEIYQLISTENGIDFSQYKGTTLARRIERRIEMQELKNIYDYYELLQRNPQELANLSKDMLIGVTRFFRDSEMFDILKHTLIPRIFDNTSLNKPIRVWVAGCSSGEEAYSIAILLDEEIRRRGEARAIKIFATDVDPEAIHDASNGHFSLDIAPDLGEERIRRYFTRDEDRLSIIPALRQVVIFATHNLLKDPPFSNCQLVLCRNVLIYLQSKAQNNILAMLQFALKKDGILVLGNSESLGESAKNYTVIDERHRIYQKNHEIRAVRTSGSNSRTEFERKNRPPSVEHLVKNYQRNHKLPAYLPILESLITQYVPACIVLSDEMDVLHIYGEVAPYTRTLKSGRFSAKISDYISEELNIAVTTAINRSLTNRENTHYSSIQYKSTSGELKHIGLRVLYIESTVSVTAHLALLFEKQHSVLTDDTNSTVKYEHTSESQQRITDLEDALRKNQENLHVTVEELETANEELQSSNEELMAANEELQSTNEEIQSVNEELYTVNSEYQEKIHEVSQVNLDINNIIRSADIGFIFLDDAMLIRRFSPVVTDTINLLESDIGRPFHHISHSLKYDRFLNDIAHVIESEGVVEKEVLSTSGIPMLVKISPLYSETNSPLGCVISIVDISETRSLENRLEESYRELRSTLETVFCKTRKTVRILLVDDDKADRITIVTALKSINDKNQIYDIKQADSFEKAQRLLSHQAFDVGLVDYNLGEHSGLDLIEGIHSETNAPAFIVLSGEIDNYLNDNATRLGIYDIIAKHDITPPLLERSIRYTQRHKQTEVYLASQLNKDDL